MMDRQEIVELGRTSGALYQLFGDRIRHQKEKLMRLIIAEYRNGEHTHISIERRIAAYCAIEDFESELVKETRAANIAIAKERS